MMNNFPYEMMTERADALERLDLKVYWGNYEIRVLRFHLITFPPGKMVSFHKHAEYEFHFIPRGKGMVILEQEPFTLREGMFYLTGPGVMHYQEADAEEAMDELCLHVDIVNLAEKEKGQGRRTRHAADPWEISEAQDCMEKLKTLPLKYGHGRSSGHALFPGGLSGGPYEICRAVYDDQTQRHPNFAARGQGLRIGADGGAAARKGHEGFGTSWPWNTSKPIRRGDRLGRRRRQAAYQQQTAAADPQGSWRRPLVQRDFGGLPSEIDLQTADGNEGSDRRHCLNLEGFSSGSYLHTVFKKDSG